MTKDEALRLAWDALEDIGDEWGFTSKRTVPKRKEAITAIKEALAQTQEPWCMKMNDCKTKCEDCPDEPPQRTWVGLTLDERIELAQDVDWAIGAYCEYAEKIEDKLKEKNT